MRRLFGIVLLLVFAQMNLFSQTLDALWKRHAEAVSKDLPRNQIEILDSIIDIATKNKQYGHLLKAQLKHVEAVTSITPDSLEIEVKRLVEAEKAAAKQPVLAAVYQSVLGKVYEENRALDENSSDISKDYFAKSLANPSMLAAVKAGEFVPLLELGKDSKYFNDDLLSVLASETQNFALLEDFYSKKGNREAACIAAAFNLRSAFNRYSSNDALMEKVDSLLSVYGDLDVAGELALVKYDLMNLGKDPDPADLVAYIDRMVAKYEGWPRIASLQNSRSSLIQKSYSYSIDSKVMLPNRQHNVDFSFIRNIDALTISVWKLDVDADERFALYNKKEIDKLRKRVVKGTEQTIRKEYHGHREFDVFKDTMMLPPLPPGVYLMNVRANDAPVASDWNEGEVQQDWNVFFVSDVYLISEALPDDAIRLAVVSATTGKPLPNAMIKLNKRYGEDKIATLKCDAKGEVLTSLEDCRRAYAKAYTKTDNFCPSQSMWTQEYYFNTPAEEKYSINIFTDRAIYRPGQTVYFALVSVVNYKGKEAKVLSNQTINVALRDANSQTVEELKVVTDEYGKASGQFILPAKGLTGNFSLHTYRGSHSFRVEEYKRPTFEVEIDEVEEVYKNGDTITVKGRAKTYSGVPVQGAKVSYQVIRRKPSWWWYDGNDDDELLLEKETTTDENGEFSMTVPILMPENVGVIPLWRARCYNIVAEAVVTDMGGESHEASTSMPIGDKATSLSFRLPEKCEASKFNDLRFSLVNISGNEVDGEVTYYIDDNPQAYTAKANTTVPLPVKAEKLGSGKHTIKAICQGDTVTEEIILFTLHDKKPPVETHDWFYATASQFPADGKPVYVQVGSSDPDTYVFYNVFADKKIIESGTMTLDRANNTKTWKYKSEYGNGILLTFAWVRDGKLYTHKHTISKPVVDKSIHLSWETFRKIGRAQLF